MIFGIFGLFRKNIWWEVFVWVGFFGRLAGEMYDDKEISGDVLDCLYI